MIPFNLFSNARPASFGGVQTNTSGNIFGATNNTNQGPSSPADQVGRGSDGQVGGLSRRFGNNNFNDNNNSNNEAGFEGEMGRPAPGGYRVGYVDAFARKQDGNESNPVQETRTITGLFSGVTKSNNYNDTIGGGNVFLRSTQLSNAGSGFPQSVFQSSPNDSGYVQQASRVTKPTVPSVFSNTGNVFGNAEDQYQDKSTTSRVRNNINSNFTNIFFKAQRNETNTSERSGPGESGDSPQSSVKFVRREEQQSIFERAGFIGNPQPRMQNDAIGTGVERSNQQFDQKPISKSQNSSERFESYNNNENNTEGRTAIKITTSQSYRPRERETNNDVDVVLESSERKISFNTQDRATHQFFGSVKQTGGFEAVGRNSVRPPSSGQGAGFNGQGSNNISNTNGGQQRQYKGTGNSFVDGDGGRHDPTFSNNSNSSGVGNDNSSGATYNSFRQGEPNRNQVAHNGRQFSQQRISFGKRGEGNTRMANQVQRPFEGRGEMPRQPSEGSLDLKRIPSVAEYVVTDNSLAERALSRCIVLVPKRGKSFSEERKVVRNVDVLLTGIRRVSSVLNIPLRYVGAEGVDREAVRKAANGAAGGEAADTIGGSSASSSLYIKKDTSPCVCAVYYSLAGAQECRAILNCRHPISVYRADTTDPRISKKSFLNPFGDSQTQGSFSAFLSERTLSYLNKLLHVVPIKEGSTASPGYGREDPAQAAAHNIMDDTPLGGTLVIFGLPKTIPSGSMSSILSRIASLENDDRLKHRQLAISSNSVIDSHCVLGVRFTPSKTSHCFVECDDTRDAAALCCALDGATTWGGADQTVQQIHIEESRPGGKRKVLMASVPVSVDESRPPRNSYATMIKYPAVALIAIKATPIGEDIHVGLRSYGDTAFVVGYGVTIELGLFLYIDKLYAVPNDGKTTSHIFYVTLRSGYDPGVLAFVRPSRLNILYSPYTVEIRMLGLATNLLNMEKSLIPLFLSPFSC